MNSLGSMKLWAVATIAGGSAYWTLPLLSDVIAIGVGVASIFAFGAAGLYHLKKWREPVICSHCGRQASLRKG